MFQFYHQSRRWWILPIPAPRGIMGELEASVVVVEDAHGWRLRNWTRSLARRLGVGLVFQWLDQLVAEPWPTSDREINRLFSHPRNREAVIVIDGADALFEACDDVRHAYLLQRIAAHGGTVVLGVERSHSLELPGIALWRVSTH